jgi:hypothetical protein
LRKNEPEKPERKKCGDCARFKVPDAGCPNYESFSEYVDGCPLMDADCAACSDFLEKGAYELGDYVFKVKGQLVLVYEGAEPLYPIKISGLDSLMNRKALAKSLNLDQTDVDRLAAKILADHESAVNEKTKEQEPKPSTPSDIQAKAKAILETGDPIEYVADVVQLIHYGDREKTKITWLSTLYYELNIVTVGTTGVGKSDLVYAVLCAVPDEYVVRLKECSPKALFYAVRAGVNLDKCTLYFDDVPDDPETVKMLKDITSENRVDPRLWTVTKEREHLDVVLEGNFNVLASAIKTMSDEGDQILRRFVVVNPNEDPEVNVQVMEKIKLGMRLGRGKRWMPPDFDVAKEVTRQIKEADFEVHIPFDFEFPVIGTVARSELKQFMALVCAVAKARFKQRIVSGRMLFAEPKDLETAVALWSQRQSRKISVDAERILEELPGQEPQLTYSDEKEEVMAYSPEPVTSTTLARKLKEKPRDLRDTLDHLFNIGYVDRKAIGGRGNPFAYWKVPLRVQNGKDLNDLGDSETPKSLGPIRLKNPENSINDYYAQMKAQYPELDMEKVHHNYMERIILLNPGFPRNNHKPESSPISEKEANDLGDSETPKSLSSIPEPPKGTSDVNDHFSDNNEDSSKFDLNPSVTEENVLGWLRLNWKGSTEQELDKRLMTQGYTAEQAKRLRVKWLSQGLLRNRLGMTVWANGDEIPSVKEVLEKMRGLFVEGREEEFLAHAVEAGLSEDEAHSLFESLKGEELFWLDRPEDGKTVWRWVHE